MFLLGLRWFNRTPFSSRLLTTPSLLPPPAHYYATGIPGLQTRSRWGPLLSSLATAPPGAEPPGGTREAKREDKQGSDGFIYIDGSCLDNTGSRSVGSKAAGGIGIYFGAGDGRNLSEGYSGPPPTTNQRTELWAFVRALEITRQSPAPAPAEVIRIRSDSTYLVKAINQWIHRWVANGWITTNGRPPLNLDLFRTIHQQLRLLKKEGRHITLEYVPRERNRHADELAKTGSA